VSFFTVVVHCLIRMRLSHLSRVLLLHTLIVQPYPSSLTLLQCLFFLFTQQGLTVERLVIMAELTEPSLRTPLENTAPAAHGHVVP
jgi:hypothetical protein